MRQGTEVTPLFPGRPKIKQQSQGRKKENYFPIGNHQLNLAGAHFCQGEAGGELHEITLNRVGVAVS